MARLYRFITNDIDFGITFIFQPLNQFGIFVSDEFVRLERGTEDDYFHGFCCIM